MRKRVGKKPGQKGTSDPLYRDRGYAEARAHETEEMHEFRRIRQEHIRCGGGYLVRRKKIGGE